LAITRGFLGHRTITDDVLAEHVIDVLRVTPLSGSRFLSQNMPAVTSGGICSTYLISQAEQKKFAG